METMVERQHPRVALPLTVVLDCMSGRREVRVTDLSIGGCYIDSITGVQPEEVVGLKFLLPNRWDVEILGTIAYVHPGIGFGVQFNDMTREQRTTLEAMIMMNGGTIE